MVVKILGKCTAFMKILSHLGSWFIVWVTFSGLLDLEDEDTTIRQDISKYLSTDMAWHARRCKSTTIPLWEP
jgi:hypothetical protein